MYFFFNQKITDPKTFVSFTGTLYHERKKIEGEFFSGGKKNDENKFEKPFTLIVDETDSYYKKKTFTDRILVYAVDAGTPPVVSPKLVEFFENLHIENVQFFDLKIKASDFELTDYKIMNVVGKYDCMDEKKSSVRYRGSGTILHVGSLVLDASKMPKNLKLFRIDRIPGNKILVSEDLKIGMENAKLTGIECLAINSGK